VSGIPVHDLKSMYETKTSRVSLLHAEPDGLRRSLLDAAGYLPVKRALDLLLIIVTLPLVIPILVVIAILVRIDTPGPVLFWQERVGKGGRSFRMVKFRSMRSDAEINGAQFAEHEDDRVTSLGRFLRRYRLDELPQLWNVLRGEMSIVGPRPEQVEFARRFADQVPMYKWRHQVKPGITGWAQVHHGYAADVKSTVTKLEYDLYYLKHLSLALDMSIMLRTIFVVIKGFGAR